MVIRGTDWQFAVGCYMSRIIANQRAHWKLGTSQRKYLRTLHITRPSFSWEPCWRSTRDRFTRVVAGRQFTATSWGQDTLTAFNGAAIEGRRNSPKLPSSWRMDAGMHLWEEIKRLQDSNLNFRMKNWKFFQRGSRVPDLECNVLCTLNFSVTWQHWCRADEYLRCDVIGAATSTLIRMLSSCNERELSGNQGLNCIGTCALWCCRSCYCTGQLSLTRCGRNLNEYELYWI